MSDRTSRGHHDLYQRDSRGLIPPVSSKDAKYQDRQELYLHVILEAAEAIGRFVDGLQKDDFLKDELRQSAVIHKLGVIGTAVSGLPRNFFEKHREINWRAVSKFRFVGLHAYFSTVDTSILWITATRDVPIIRDKIAQILRSLT